MDYYLIELFFIGFDLIMNFFKRIFYLAWIGFFNFLNLKRTN